MSGLSDEAKRMAREMEDSVAVTNASAAAYPVHGGYGFADDSRNRILGGGMTKRELIAMHALQGLLAYDDGDGNKPDDWTLEQHQEHYARVSVGYADALLKELAK